LAQSLDASTYAKVEEMVHAEDYLSRLQVDYAPRFEHSGAALADEQLLPLATIMHDEYAAQTAPSNAERGQVDPATGLSAADQSTLKRSGAVLNGTQRKILES